LWGLWLYFYDQQTGREKFQWHRVNPYGAQAVHFSPDSSKVFLFSGTDLRKAPTFIAFDIETRTEINFQTNDIVVDGVFNGNPENPILITRNRGGSIGFWNWKQHKQLVSLPLKSGEVQDIAVSPDGKIVAVATNEQIHFIEISTQKRVGNRDYEHPKVKRIRFADDNRHFASLGADGELRVWSLDFMKSDPPTKIAPQYDGASF
jgi:WD40 repeat protein